MNHDKKILTFLIGIICIFSSYSQTSQNIVDIEKSILDIKSKLSFYKKIEKINTNDGSRFVFFNGNELKLITVRVIEPSIEKNVEWFYKNGQIEYIETNWLDIKTKKNIYHEKCYFTNGRLIAWINPQNNLVDGSSEEFKKLDTYLSAYCIKIKADAMKL